MQPWLQTLGGGALDLLDPQPEQINLHHVARVLSRIPRFGGHTEGPAREIYSVAQHSIEGARAILRDTGRKDAAAAFLLHDAKEYALGDWATPVKDALMTAAEAQYGFSGLIVRYTIKRLERGLDTAIHARAGLPYPLAPDVAKIVKEYDVRMCRTERDARLAAPPRAWCDAVERALPVGGCDLSPWLPGIAETWFVQKMRDCGVQI